MPTTRKTADALSAITGDPDESSAADFALPDPEQAEQSRQSALNALLQPSQPRAMLPDTPRPVRVRPIPPPNGNRVTWAATPDEGVPDGWLLCLVTSKRYPRMWPVGDLEASERREAHSGDIAVLPNDKHTQDDIRRGYLIPQ